MKRIFLSLLFALATSLLSAMPYMEARQHALFLTDKMAYELNLTQQQYDYVYQINLDYFMAVNRSSEIHGLPWRYRNADLECVLYEWQWRAFRAIDYFLHPLRWWHSAWHFPIYEHYRSGYFFFSTPTIYLSYIGKPWKRRPHAAPSPYAPHRPTPPPPGNKHGGLRDHYHQQYGGHPDPRLHQPTPPPHGGKPQDHGGMRPPTGNQPGHGGKPQGDTHTSAPQPSQSTPTQTHTRPQRTTPLPQRTTTTTPQRTTTTSPQRTTTTSPQRTTAPARSTRDNTSSRPARR